jgi:hypothetical protein
MAASAAEFHRPEIIDALLSKGAELHLIVHCCKGRLRSHRNFVRREHMSAHKRSRKAEAEPMRAAAKELDAMIAAWASSEDELMRDYKEIQRARGEKNRSGTDDPKRQILGINKRNLHGQAWLCGALHGVN